MFAGPRVVAMRFMRATDSREVENLRHACKTAVNVRQRSANASCSHSIPERGDGALHMPEKKGMKLIVEYDIHGIGTCCKTGRCASLENHDEDCDGSEFRIVMVLPRQLVLSTLSAAT